METVFILYCWTNNGQEEWNSVVDVYIKRDDAITEQNRLEKQQDPEQSAYKCWHISEMLLK